MSEDELRRIEAFYAPGEDVAWADAAKLIAEVRRLREALAKEHEEGISIAEDVWTWRIRAWRYRRQRERLRRELSEAER